MLEASEKTSTSMEGPQPDTHAPANDQPVSHQLPKWKETQKEPEILTTNDGKPIGSKSDVMTVGPRGPMLLQDTVYLEEITHFDRERIPERVVHAKGGGAFGYFECTHDISKYTKACVFSEVGKRTPLLVRFSTVIGERGSADTVRDPRGFAIKMYTEQGNWDLVANNTPIFFVRDPILFPNIIHAMKRNPVTNLKDANMFWDFMTLRPETTHQLMYMFGDRGIPDGFRHMNGYGSHAFKFVNAQREACYVKFHIKSDQGVKNLLDAQGRKLASTDPDYGVRDLFNAIESGSFPSWTFYVQIMTFDEAEAFPFNPFDLTKVWPHGQWPLIPCGKIVLNRNPRNYFAEIEQASFDVSSMIAGVEPSPDKMLQGRLISYMDTHYHRLGTNYKQIPVNCPYRCKIANYTRDGPFVFNDGQDGAPTYHPNSFHGPVEYKPALEHEFALSGDVGRFNSHDDDNFTQPAVFWKKVLNEEEKKRMVENIAGHAKDANEPIRARVVRMFAQVDSDFGVRLEKQLHYELEQVKAEHLLDKFRDQNGHLDGHHET